MNLRTAWLGWLSVGAIWLAAATVEAEEPATPVKVTEEAVAEEEVAEPILPAESTETKADAASETATATATATDAAPATGENAGLEDLDKAAQLKVNAENLPDLTDVIDKLDSAIEKGLDKDNQSFAEQLLISSLLQRATVLSSAVLRQPVEDLARDPRVMQLRQFAVNDLQRVISMDDKIAEAHLMMGRMQSLPLGDDKTAKRELTKVVDSADATADERAQALALRGTLQTDEAKRAADFDQAIALLPEKPDYYRVRAQNYFRQEKFAEALKDVDKALELDADNPPTLELKGMILLGLKRYDESLAAFSKASELAPEAVVPHQRLSLVYQKQGDLKKSVEQLTKALELEPNDANTLLLRANVLYQTGDVDGAIKDVDAAIALQPNQLLGHLLKSEILASAGRLEEATATLEKLVPLAPNQPKLLDPLATFYLLDNRPRKSIELFTKIIELDPQNYKALRFRGDGYLNIGKHAEALADFDAALALNDADEGLLNNLAWVLATSPDDKVRDGKRSLELANRAADLTSHNTPHILSTLGAAYAETGDFESAKKWSNEAIKLTEEEIKTLELAKEDSKSASNDKLLEGLKESLKNLQAELAGYEAGKPVRERQEMEEKPTTPAARDHTSTPAAEKPAAAEVPAL
jgi:tetratricopeptide (TPR) repeat protein